MKIEDYEKYYQSVGFYVIPTEVFNELFNEMEAWKEQVKNIETIRLDQTKKVFDTIAGIIKEGSCSYRHLIYDKLGFDGKYYEELLSGMTITNAICDLEELREQHEEDLEEIEKLTSLWKTNAEEKRELKKQLEEINNFIKKSGFVNIEQTMLNYCGLLTQQERFINYLEEEIKLCENDILNFSKDYKVYFSLINDLRVSKTKIEEILQKYKEIMEIK